MKRIIFKSPEFETEYRNPPSSLTAQDDTFPKWLEDSTFFAANCGGRLFHTSSCLCEILTEMQLPSRKREEGEKFKYRRVVSVSIQPDCDPVELREVLTGMGYQEI